MKDKRDLAAPCGLDCFNCEIYEDNLTYELARAIPEKLGVSNEEGDIRKKYFRGKFIVGNDQAGRRHVRMPECPVQRPYLLKPVSLRSLNQTSIRGRVVAAPVLTAPAPSHATWDRDGSP